MGAFGNRAWMSTATTGTGTITLGSAQSGYQSFADAGITDGQVIDYVIIDSSDWEVGTGTYTSTGTTLTRNVSESSNSDSALNLSGSATVYWDAPATRMNDLQTALEGHLFGLTLSNNSTDSTNDIDIATGSAASGGSPPYLMTLSSGLTKQLDVAWAVGTNAGGLDTGSIADGTYHVFLIQRSDTGVVDALFSTSASSPTMPSNYDRKRRIGSIVRASSTILSFIQNGNNFRLLTPITDVAATGTGTARTSRTLSVPSGIVVFPDVSVKITSGPGSGNALVLLTSLDETDTAPTTSINHSFIAATSSNGPMNSVTTLHTDTSAQIGSRESNTNSQVKIVTFGWKDLRDQNA